MVTLFGHVRAWTLCPLGVGQVHPHSQSSAWPQLCTGPKLHGAEVPMVALPLSPCTWSGDPPGTWEGQCPVPWVYGTPCRLVQLQGEILKTSHPCERWGQMRITWEKWDSWCWGVWKHILVPGESASQGDKHHRFRQERAHLAQELSSYISFVPDPPPFLSVLFPTVYFRQCLIGVLAFANPIRRRLPHPASSDLSPSSFSSARGCAVGTGQEPSPSAVLQTGWDVTPARAARVDGVAGCRAGLVPRVPSLPGLCTPGVNSSRAPEVTALKPNRPPAQTKPSFLLRSLSADTQPIWWIRAFNPITQTQGIEQPVAPEPGNGELWQFVFMQEMFLCRWQSHINPQPKTSFQEWWRW